MSDMARILIISNNPLSSTENNGKTLLSLFAGCGLREVRQLYFQAAEPTIPLESYYRITDKDMLKAFVGKSNKLGKTIWHTSSQGFANLYNPSNILKRSHLLRLLRELIWVSVCNNTELLQWSDGFSPELVFLLAGNSVFAYKLADYLCCRYKAKLILYITDDYVSRACTISPFFWLHRSAIEQATRSAASKASLFLTISEKMRQEYKELYGADSIVFRNEARVRLAPSYTIVPQDENPVVLVYAGGLHYNRWKVLSRIGKAIELSNRSNTKKMQLRVYCTQRISQRVKKAISLGDASLFLGGINQEELERVYATASVLVHVEAFDEASKRAVRMSFSTKIPEYLALGKCMMAVGPKDVASMEHLADCAYCLTCVNDITAESLSRLVDPGFRYSFALKATACARKESEHVLNAVDFNGFVERMVR